MISAYIDKLISGQNLTIDESAELLNAMLSDDASDISIAAALKALAAKGESEDELAGFAQVMRARCLRVKTKHEIFIDTCGTGGSKTKTFNVSTASAFVVAGAGLPVAKHGNRAVTSNSGSADVLRALGINIDIPPDKIGSVLDDIGICFMFAPAHHTATKRVAAVRRELGIRTIFNFIGPLTNPAHAPYQLIGVSDEKMVSKIAHAAWTLPELKQAWIIHGSDGSDEITLGGATTVISVSADQPLSLRKTEITPEDFGLKTKPMSNDELRGGGAEENAAIILDVLSGKRNDAARDLVVINSAAALYLADLFDDMKQAAKAAFKSIDSGNAFAKLNALREKSN